MEVCYRFHEVLQTTIIGQITKEIEKLERYSKKKNVRILTV